MWHDRFTRKSRTARTRTGNRRNIPPDVRREIFERDESCCQYCHKRLDEKEYEIDHLVPVALGGVHEMTNFVTACGECNRKKSDMTPEAFAAQIGLKVAGFPVHGDAILDNASLPWQIQVIRKRVYDRMRSSTPRMTGARAHKRVEREFRRDLSRTPEGRAIETQAPTIPGHARAMAPEIDVIATTPAEHLLLIELSKSATTRNLIGTVLVRGCDVIKKVQLLATSTDDEPLRIRLNQALLRLKKEQGSKENAKCASHGAPA